MQAPRTSTKAVDAMDTLIDRLRVAYADRDMTPMEFTDVMDAALEAAYLVGKADAQLTIGMVALKSGPDSDRYRQVTNDYRKTYPVNVIAFPSTKMHRPEATPDDVA